MTELYTLLRGKIKRTYLKLLKAEAKHNVKRAAKLEGKIIRLELQLSEELRG